MRVESPRMRAMMLAGLVAVVASGGGFLAARTRFGGVGDAAAAGEISASRRTAVVTAAQRVSPSVVSVSVVASRVVRSDPFGGVLRDEFFDRFFPPTEYRQRIPGLGSGFIVDPGGTIMTNEHVVRDADDIKVTLSDGRQLKARLLGASPIYDVAVLKVDASGLPAVRLGDSDHLVVGEWAIAIGSPFGYLLSDTQPTVTAGVVSATRRDIKSEASNVGVYKNMIQTDAAINPGNSGGPLVNADGEVIGINSFIFTQGGGSIGLGFAIPINLGRRILGELQKYGRIRIAWPGFTVQAITPYLAQRLGFRDTEGLVVSRVDPDGPAARAGVKPGDRVRSVNERPIRNVDDAQRSIYGAEVGDRLKLELDRAGRSLTLTVTLEEAPRSGEVTN
ncbi:MAG: trypsin-like serine protease [Candidatus Eisenbacteria bacterium]|uniref:Trypsin-like serine protease n=1 Tax=Eiseniibacteriota bacterium TaxID=2212470 RepID=A0A849SHW5_UNCEI|nr:trypsin-like serine protease [Candidatus Eisenbacteria bacterium]